MAASRLEAWTHNSRQEKVFWGPVCFCASAQRQSDGNFRTERKPSYSSLASTVRRAAASTNSTRNARPFAVSVIDKKVDIYMAPPYNMGAINAFQRALQDAQEAYGIEWSEIK